LISFSVPVLGQENDAALWIKQPSLVFGGKDGTRHCDIVKGR
jgi:hypothetical protein